MNTPEQTRTNPDAFTDTLMAALRAEGYDTMQGGTGGGCTAVFVTLPTALLLLTDGDAQVPDGIGGYVGVYVGEDEVMVGMTMATESPVTVADYLTAVKVAEYGIEHGYDDTDAWQHGDAPVWTVPA